MNFRLLCFIIFCSLSLSCFSQADSSMRLSREEWRAMSEGVDYTETYNESEQKKAQEPVKENSGTSDYRLGNFKYVFYVLVLAIIVLIIYWVFKNLKANKEIPEKTISIASMKEVEENIHEVNLEALLKDALLAKNYRIALRLNFLIVIKLLSQTERINWTKDKTNWEYYAELKEKLIADQFRLVIQSFENFWYGEHVLTEYDYLNAEPVYRALKDQLSKP